MEKRRENSENCARSPKSEKYWSERVHDLIWIIKKVMGAVKSSVNQGGLNFRGKHNLCAAGRCQRSWTIFSLLPQNVLNVSRRTETFHPAAALGHWQLRYFFASSVLYVNFPLLLHSMLLDCHEFFMDEFPFSLSLFLQPLCFIVCSIFSNL